MSYFDLAHVVLPHLKVSEKIIRHEMILGAYVHRLPLRNLLYL